MRSSDAKCTAALAFLEEFVRRYEAGELDEGDPDVSDLAGLLWLGQNGRRAAA